jgi:hypothetical protein
MVNTSLARGYTDLERRARLSRRERNQSFEKMAAFARRAQYLGLD